MDNPEKLATLGTQDKQNKQHNTICVGHHSQQANKNNVNKTWALLQTTKDKYEPNIGCPDGALVNTYGLSVSQMTTDMFRLS
jgi:hypothetical protein